MKYIKKYESFRVVEYDDNDSFKCVINITELNDKEIRAICNKLIEWFPKYRFQSDYIDISDTDAKYLKINVKDYNYIVVSKTYTYMEEQFDTAYEAQGYVFIDGKLALLSDSKDDFIQKVKMTKDTNKFNI